MKGLVGQTCTSAALLRKIFFLLVVVLLAVATFAQTPRAIPYYVSVFAGIPGESSATFPYTVGAACPSGKIALDKYGDGCLVTEAVFDAAAAVVFDSNGNAYIADADPSANFGFVRKVDAVTGIITMFAGGMTAASSSGSPCAAYTKGGNTGPDLAVSDLAFANPTEGDGCPGEDPVTGAPYTYFKSIRGLAIDANYLYIADYGNSKIRKISLSTAAPVDPYHYYANEVEPVAGYGSSLWSQDGSVNTVQIKNPYAIAVDSSGNIFFSDQGGNSVRKVTPTVYSVVNGGITVTPGSIITVLNCAASGSVCTTPVAGCPAVEVPSTPAQNTKTNTVTGLAFDSKGNLYAAAKGCYSIDMLEAGVDGVTGSDPVALLVGSGVNGTNGDGAWIPAFNSTLIAQSGTRGITAGPNGSTMYIINSTNAWIYDPTDTANGAVGGWMHEIWGGNTSGEKNCKSTDGTYYNCPAPDSAFSSTYGGGTIDPTGSLYVADTGDNMILKASTGTDFIGFGPAVSVVNGNNQFNDLLIHGGSSFSVSPTPPFVLSQLGCSTYAVGDLGSDCTFTLDYVPTANGLQTGTLNASGTLIPVRGSGIGFPYWVWANVTCANKVYDGTTNESLSACSCGLTLGTVSGGTAVTDPNVSCVITSVSLNQSLASADVTATAQVSLTGTNAGKYILSDPVTTTSININPAPVTANVTGANKVYDGTTSEPIANTTCTVTGNLPGDVVTCAGGSAVFASPNAGSGVVVTVSGITLGGTAAGNYVLSSTLATTTATIGQATPKLSIACPSGVYNGSPYTCTETALGVDGVTPVAGSFACVQASETDTGTYNASCTFTSTDPNYLSGGTVSGSFTITAATQAPVIKCYNGLYDGTPHSCTISNGIGCATPASYTDVPGGPVSVTCAGDKDHNAATVNGTVTVIAIAPALSITCNSGLANGYPRTCSCTASGPGGAVPPGVCNLTYNGSTAAPAAAGNYAIVGQFSSSSVDYLAGAAATTLVINPSTLPTITYAPTPLAGIYGTALNVKQLCKYVTVTAVESVVARGKTTPTTENIVADGTITFTDSIPASVNGLSTLQTTFGCTDTVVPSAGPNVITATWTPGTAANQLPITGNPSFVAVTSAPKTINVSQYVPALKFKPTARPQYPLSITDTVTYLAPTATEKFTRGGAPVAGTWAFSDTYTPSGSATANPAIPLNPAGHDLLHAGAHEITATFTPEDTNDYQAGSVIATINIKQGRLTVAYTKPDTTGLTYGQGLTPAYFTAVTTNQVGTDVTSDICGSIAYTDGVGGTPIDPTADVVLAAGSHKIAAACASNDTVDYPDPKAATEAVKVSTYLVTPLLTYTPANLAVGGTVGTAQTLGAVNSPVNPYNNEAIVCAWVFSPVAGTAEPKAKAISAKATCTPQRGSGVDPNYKAGTVLATYSVK